MSKFFIAALGLCLATSAHAEVLRFRHVPVDANGNTGLAKDAQGAAGQRSTWMGGTRQPFFGQIKPNYVVTFRHPYSGRNVNVPMSLPDGAPRMEYLRHRIVYHYGTYEIRVLFNEDGTVDTLYNSGLLRPIQ
jgi:hypothetical protein